MDTEREEQTSRKGLVTCRAGLERVVASELRNLNIEVTRIGNRAVFIRGDNRAIVRANMALRSALNVLVPLRTFNARNYDMLYFQSRKTFWHKMFSVDCNLRIDVNGGSDNLRNTEYVVHRVKDGIVDTFRKLCDGRRPSIDKRDPDVHIVVHLDGPRVTLCMDTSGQPLFKRGYRERHGVAPLKEDLAAGILELGGWDGRSPLCDPMCGAGTFLFEAYLRSAEIAPNVDRRFGFEALSDYNPALHTAEREALHAKSVAAPAAVPLFGIESDSHSHAICEHIRGAYFSKAPIEIRHGDFRDLAELPAEWFIVCNPPYGKRLGSPASLHELYRALGKLILSGGKPRRAAILTASPDAGAALGVTPRRTFRLYNGAIPCELLCFS